jgi:squalene-hopene/tetraprenyl-beta-curcumene cyclase
MTKLSSRHLAAAGLVAAILAGVTSVASAQHMFAQQGAPRASWDARAAAAYLDARQGWWMGWPTASRDHETSCVSCHTALPYALARPALRVVLNETELSTTERKMLDNVTKRVRLWKEVEAFYPDQTRGLPKTSESRGTEAILNALILATRDAVAGKMSDDGRSAFDNLWALQFRSGDLSGAWAWLNFHLEPWESTDAAYFGATLAAVAVGTEPEAYAARAEIQTKLKPLGAYLQRGLATQSLFNRAMVLWASAKIPGLMQTSDRQTIIDALWAAQQPDGGWSLSSLGQWKRIDGTPLETQSDGYATGLAAYALQQAGASPAEPHVANALAWLEQHQDRATGMWSATSLNKQRDPATDIGKFMSDAATAYAVLALTQSRQPRAAVGAP